jgi:hypothetical protein
LCKRRIWSIERNPFIAAPPAYSTLLALPHLTPISGANYTQPFGQAARIRENETGGSYLTLQGLTSPLELPPPSPLK